MKTLAAPLCAAFALTIGISIGHLVVVALDQ